MNEHRVSLNRLALGAWLLTFVVTSYFAYTALRASHVPFIMYVCLLAGVLGLVILPFFMGQAVCPECGTMRQWIGLKNNKDMECRGCSAYFRTEQGEVVQTEADAITEMPVFATACPQKIAWPQGCCVCQQEVTHHASVTFKLEEDVPIAQDLLTQAATLGMFKRVSVREFSIDVPVCAAHKHDNAELDWNYDEAQLYIAFRSRAYMTAFAQQNGPVFWGD